MVSEMKKRPELSGSDFLPMILKIDDLLAHLRSIRELASRLSTLREVPPQQAAAQPQQGQQQLSPDATMTMRGPNAPPPSAVRTPADELAQTLSSLAERLAGDHGKKFRLSMNGLNAIPRSYLTTVKDVLIQMLRNSAVHGIEAGEVRRAQAKDAIGSVRVDVLKSADHVELTFEDDGAGLLPEQLKAAAVRKQIVTAEEAAAMDTRAAMALIFKPGFSTAESVTMDAGRGIGMDVVAKSVYALGGKIGVSTNPGKFTRFKVSLPASAGEASSTAVA
jgi:two-component system chemotaxis sensor kinase CheA